MRDFYVSYFQTYIRKGVEQRLLDGRLLQFDLERLADALQPGARSVIYISGPENIA